MAVILRAVSAWFALLAALTAFGLVVPQNTAHAVGWLAASALFYVLATLEVQGVT